MPAGLHSRHVCYATHRTWLLCHTADMSAVPHNKHVYCVTQRTCLLRDATDIFQDTGQAAPGFPGAGSSQGPIHAGCLHIVINPPTTCGSGRVDNPHEQLDTNKIKNKINKIDKTNGQSRLMTWSEEGFLTARIAVSPNPAAQKSPLSLLDKHQSD